MPPYPGDPPEWRTFSGSYLDWQPSDEGSSTVTALTTENERLRAELAGVREELAAARGRTDRRDSDRLTHYEWLGRYLALPRRQHRGIMRWVVEHVWRMLAGAKQKFDDTLINWVTSFQASHHQHRCCRQEEAQQARHTSLALNPPTCAEHLH
ncbi:unnamed protein product [Aureobasidium pullulans]|nr:unnamed protein product [Aureobasidium pullulans]